MTAIRDMHNQRSSKISFEKVYRSAYVIVLKRYGDPLYTQFETLEKDWMLGNVQPKLLAMAPTWRSDNIEPQCAEYEQFMRGMLHAFNSHTTVVSMASDVLMYLDRTYSRDEKKPKVNAMAMGKFSQYIMQEAPKAEQRQESQTETEEDPKRQALGKQLVGVILTSIMLERTGHNINTILVRDSVDMLCRLYQTTAEVETERLYDTMFERGHLESTQSFYRNEAQVYIKHGDAARYCRNTLSRIREEANRCDTMLAPETKLKILRILEEELIKKKLAELVLVETGVKNMIENDNFHDLNMIYILNRRVDNNKAEVTKAVSQGILDSGHAINDAAASTGEGDQGLGKPKSAGEKPLNPNQQTISALEWVRSMLNLKEKYDQLWMNALESDSVVQPAMTRSLSECININPRSSEFISLYLDDNMKKGLKDKTDDEIDQVLNKAITLLRYINDKDLFERYYKKHLCKRLLMSKSLSIDHEREMIRKMKVELGNSFVSKLEVMFKDMTLSDGLTTSYRSRVSAGGSSQKLTDLSIHVLTSLTWPLETMQPNNLGSGEDGRNAIIFPPTIERVKHGFNSFYAEKHSGRKLTWMPNMGTADIRATFPMIPGQEGTPLGKERRHELNVSTYAMIVLMLFNDLPSGASYTFDDIQSRTNIPTPELTRNLQSLAVAPKTRILRKEPMSKDINPNDRFFYNEQFTSPYLRIKVGVVAGGDKNRLEGDRERRETERKNDETRGYAVEAAVVRNMK